MAWNVPSEFGASLPNIMLREAEVIAHDADAVPPAGAHDGGDVVAANEEVLRRAHALETFLNT